MTLQIEPLAVTPDNYDPIKEAVERIEGMQLMFKLISKRTGECQQELEHAKAEYRSMKKMQATMIDLIERAQAELVTLRDREMQREQPDQAADA